MPQFVLLLREDPAVFEATSPEEMQEIMMRYKEWADRIRAIGKLAGVQKLVDGEGKVLGARQGSVTVTDGPYAESKEVIGGYFILEASGYDEVRSLAADCPHLQFGSIEVRRIHVLE